MNSNYRIKETFHINYDDPNPNPKCFYTLEKKGWFGWHEVWPQWPAFRSREELLDRYYRLISHETRTNTYNL